MDYVFRGQGHILEGQFQRMKERPDFATLDYAHDSGPGKMLFVLDKLLREEAAATSAA